MRTRWATFLDRRFEGATRRPHGDMRERVFSLDMQDVEFASADAVKTGKPAEMSWWDWTVFLLHTAAEIEHALLAQYLFAAYSLAKSGFPGTSVPADAEQRSKRWQRVIAQIAREEMGHLLTVQNLLHFIGAPLNFEREDIPYRNSLYPFRFQLEPLTKDSLAKYVVAEMPAEPAQPTAVMDEIMTRATQETGGEPINRVGALYFELASLFSDEARLPSSAFRPESALGRQAAAADWFGSSILLVRSISTRDDAVRAITAIGEQGEGLWTTPDSVAGSHFDRFLNIYREYPEQSAWTPTLPIGKNPVTSAAVDSQQTTITRPDTLLWAQLANTRYRMLLALLSHALHSEGPAGDPGNRTPKGRLIDWAFQEMRGPKPPAVGGLRGVAIKLSGMPSGDDATPNCGVPFELPPSLALPPLEKDRWILHRMLCQTSQALLALLPPDTLTAELGAMDQTRQAEIDLIVANLPG